ncbi:MAG: ABC transporter substrate-binding protein, partial [Dongiaceae bacterium]
ADILFFGGYHQEAGLIVRQMRDQDVNAPLMGGDALITKEFWDITGKSGAGTLLTFNPDPRLLPEAKAVVERFKAKNIKPEGYTLYTYATFQVFAQAAAQAGGTKLNQIEPILRKASFNTVLGKLSFDAKGDVQAPGYIVYEWRDGEYRPLKDKGA